ncbi:hypothetical protein F2Q68_00010393 [Brassica cretica]|uniref:Uncharacterized protein n=1 Tax=Brassica cretica TaxID=69181 RepID=A0A3N6RLS4_BRACR|nr:hypothetical protein F2Q68_00010393 [Brassica cretica]
MVDLLICCSEHDVSRCFSEHGGTLLMSWRSWPEPVRNLALAAVEVVSSGYGRLGPLFFRINHSAWKLEAGSRPGDRDPDPGVGTRNLGAGTRNLEAGTRNPEAGVISSWNIFPQHLHPSIVCIPQLCCQH